MFSALTSLIWGTEQEEPAATNTQIDNKNIDEHLEVENAWIYIQPKGTTIFSLFKTGSPKS